MTSLGELMPVLFISRIMIAALMPKWERLWLPGATTSARKAPAGLARTSGGFGAAFVSMMLTSILVIATYAFFTSFWLSLR